MAFTETTILSTREPSFGSRQLGQVVAVPTGRLDKVSVFLEPKITDLDAAQQVSVKMEVFLADSGRLPTGSALASDSITLADVKTRGFRNFRLESSLPSVVVLVLSTVGATQDNHVAWRYVATSATGEELLVSENDGMTWTQDPSRKFAFIAYSFIDDVVDAEDQSAEIQAGKLLDETDDTAADWSLAELTRAVVSGDTVLVNFGDFVITLVVDQSGSMTWNDRDGLRFDFLKSYIDDLELNLPATSTATYSLVKFRSRKIGSLDIVLQSNVSGAFIDGVRIVRKVGSAPTSPSDGLVIFEGFASQFEDTGLASGTVYHYAIFVFDSVGNFSDARSDLAIPQSPPTPPLSVASLKAEEVVVLSGSDDIGDREVDLTWVHPANFDYDKITLVRRTDRFPETPSDGDVVFTDTGTVLATSFTDFDPSSLDPADHAVNGLTYYYGIFTENTATGLKTFRSNARRDSVTISVVDRVWERAESPFDVPPAGFDDTPPAAPTGFLATPGQGEILLTWSPGDAENRRYRLYFREDEFPQAQTAENGQQEFDGTLLFDGVDTGFTHRNLENGEPYFYVLVALDQVANQSSPVTTIGRPSTTATALAPAPVNNFSAEVASGSSNLLTWDLDISRASSIDAYFGDIVRITTNLTFEDSDPRRTTATLEFVEDNRQFQIYDENGSPAEDTDGEVNSRTSIIFDQAPVNDTNTLSANISMTPFTSILNQIATAKLTFHSSLNVKERDTGNVVTEVLSNTVSVNFQNPFELDIVNDPQQLVPVRTWNPACDLDRSPEYEVEQIPGVFVRSGDPFFVLLEAKFRGQALTEDIDLIVRILDANTGELTDRIELPQTGPDGNALLRTDNEFDEVLDRTGEPTGETVERSVIRLSLPPQNVPGEFVLEITGSFQGFSRTAKLDVKYVSSLNIDVKAKPFFADGVDIAEQEAFVYFGSFEDPEADKSPVTDLTVTDWEITKLSGGGPLTRPFFSRDDVPGTGIKAFTRSGIARKVFFGPGTDVEPPSTPSCTDGEIFQIKVTASALGMNAEGFAAVEIEPFEPTDLKRIFLRLAADQVDEFGNPVTTSRLANISIFSDGQQEAAWELVARPSEDTETGLRSAVDFRDKVVASGGLVPDLADGTVVNISVINISDRGSPADLTITTDLTGSSGKTARAKATVINGKAKFSIKGNFVTSGKILTRPLDSEISNSFYPTGEILFQESSRVFAVSVYATLEINGKPAIFSGGGGSVETDVPPAFISFREPLAKTDPGS